MAKLIDLTGQKFNHWTVIERAPNNKKGQSMWLCECDCDNHTRKVVNGYTLRAGKSKSCGCLQKETMKNILLEDLTGQKFGHLTVLEYAGSDANRKALWKCQCDCEAKTIVVIRSNDLKQGKTISCGCISSKGEEKISLLLSENNIPFEKEKTFPTCINPKTGALLRFDFYVNNKYLIEFDGKQHFNSYGGWSTEDKVKDLQYRDEIKNEWCKINNIPLIRINYKNINKITIKDLII